MSSKSSHAQGHGILIKVCLRVGIWLTSALPFSSGKSQESRALPLSRDGAAGNAELKQRPNVGHESTRNQRTPVLQASEEEVLREALGGLAKQASEGSAEPMDTSGTPATASGDHCQHPCKHAVKMCRV